MQGQQLAGNQNILENASARGVLRSTIPVEGQAALGSQILQQQGQLAGQEAKDIGGVQSQIGGLQVDRASTISQLANALQQASLAERGLTLDQQNANRAYKLQKQIANKQYNLNLSAARRGY